MSAGIGAIAPRNAAGVSEGGAASFLRAYGDSRELNLFAGLLVWWRCFISAMALITALAAAAHRNKSQLFLVTARLAHYRRARLLAGNR